ncbi:MAG: hypothetical protein LBH42_10230 [Treponema sp.]|nr:hypothetical protein [Treponema sp.]
MTKISIIVAVLILTAGSTYAQDENLGFSLGVEAGSRNITEVNDKDNFIYLMPKLSYYRIIDSPFGIGVFDLNTGLELTVWLWDSAVFYFDLLLRYHIDIGSASNMVFLLRNENNIDPSPVYPLGPFDGRLTPGIRFFPGFGNFYVQADYPFYYLRFDKNADFTSSLNLTVAWYIAGLTITVKENNSITPEMALYTGLDVSLAYPIHPVNIVVETYFPREIAARGITVTPQVSFFPAKGITFYGKCEFNYILANGRDIEFSPALGVLYRF